MKQAENVDNSQKSIVEECRIFESALRKGRLLVLCIELLFFS
jgi:ribosomal protein L36